MRFFERKVVPPQVNLPPVAVLEQRGRIAKLLRRYRRECLNFTDLNRNSHTAAHHRGIGFQPMGHWPGNRPTVLPSGREDG
jgi:hypothetical protein